MNIAIYTIRFLLAVLFIWHGIEKLFLHAPMSGADFNSLFIDYYNLLTESGFLLFVGSCQLLCGSLLIFKRTYLLGSVMLIPLVLCLVMTHIFISKNIGYILFDSTILLLNILLIVPDHKKLTALFLTSKRTLF